MKKILFAIIMVGVVCMHLYAMEEEDNAETDFEIYLAIREAVREGNVVKVRSFFLDVNRKDFSGDTLLHEAALGRHYEIAELLLNQGAHVNVTDDFRERTPLHLAAECGESDIEYGESDIVELLLVHHAGINEGDRNGDTPLHYAARGGNLSAVRVLLDHGADPTVWNKQNRTAADVAEYRITKGFLLDEIRKRAETLALSLEKIGMRYDVIKEVLFRFDPTYRRREQEYREHQQREGELTL